MNELEKCRNSAEYFYYNYVLINGERPYYRDADRKWFEIERLKNAEANGTTRKI